MIRTALDSEDLSVFTHDTDFILTYSDLVVDPLGFEAAHPAQQVHYIDRGLGDPGGKATIADVERFAMTPAQLPDWYDRKTADHLTYLTVYSSRDSLPAISAALGGRPVNRWVATLDGTLHITGFEPLKWPALVQIAGAAATGINADFSLVFSPGWNPSPGFIENTDVRLAIDVVIARIATAAASLTAAREAIIPFA